MKPEDQSWWEEWVSKTGGAPAPPDDHTAVARARDRQFADLIVLALGLAAQTHPEMVRSALESVFDLKGVKRVTQNVMVVATECQRAAREAIDLLRQVGKDLDEMEKRIDALRYETERLEAVP